MRTIGLLSLVSLAMVFAMLYSRYRSVLALIIMGSVPLGADRLGRRAVDRGQPLSVASMIGFITLAGIATRNGILKISHYINLAIHEADALRPDLVMRGSLERLTPVLMTALSAGLRALIPLMIAPTRRARRSCTRSRSPSSAASSARRCSTPSA
jgi:heavy-metal exporter, HME family